MTYQPKSYRKFVAGALSAAVVASAVAPTTASAAEFKGFSDVHESDYFYEAVMTLAKEGIISGKGADKYAPQDLVKREEFAKILAGAIGYDLEGVKDPGFSDVKEGEWYYKYVAALKENEITNGVGDGKFGVGQNLSRGQAAKFIVDAFGLEPVKGKDVPFKDIDKSIYKDYIETLYTNGYIKGVSADQFAPDAPITRGALAVMVYNVWVDFDTQAPKIELVGDENVEVEFGADYKDAGVKVTDNEDKDIKANVEIKNEKGEVVEKIDTTKPGKYTITYTAKDAAGNEAKPVVRTVTVKESVKPAIESVKALSKTKVEVVFTKAVDSVKAENFTVEGASVTSATLSEDKKKATLEVSGLDYDKNYAVDVKGVLVDGTATDIGTKDFKTPAVTDLWELQISPKSSSLVADGADNTEVTFTLINKITGEVDKDADNVVLDLNTTYGTLASKRVTIQDGQATVLLTSEFSNTDLSAKIDAQIIEASGDYKALIGKVVGTTSVSFVTSTTENVETATLVSAEANQADRVTLFFDKNVSLKHFVKTNSAGELLYKYTTDDGKTWIEDKTANEIPKTVKAEDIRHQFKLDNSAIIKQGNNEFVVKGFKPVAGNSKAMEVILEKTTVLKDNASVNVEVNTVNSLNKATKSTAEFKVTDARKPEATSVKAEGLNTLKVKFSEAIADANFQIDGRFDTEDAFTYNFGEFNPVTLVDNRDLATITLVKGDGGVIGKDLNAGYDEDGIVDNLSTNKTLSGYFTAGQHTLQISSTKDFAYATDKTNIGSTQNLNFTIAEDKQKPTATVTVESPEQFRIKFDKSIGLTDTQFKALLGKDEKGIKLQKYDELAGEYKDVATSDPAGVDTFNYSTDFQVSKVSDSEYVVELKRDWTEIYNTTDTNKNYYNDKYRFVVAKKAVKNVANGLENEEIKLDLNYAGSPLNIPDVTSPVINKIDRVTAVSNNFYVTMSEPVKLVVGGAVKDDATGTLAQGQTSLANTTAQFIGKDKDGKTVTINANVKGYADSDSDKADKVIEIDWTGATKTPQQFVDEGGSEDWTLVVRSLSDDVGNTAASATKEFKIAKSPATETPFFIDTTKDANGKVTGYKVVGKDNATAADTVEITFSEGVQFSGLSDATNPAQYTINGETLPKGTSIKIENEDGATHATDKGFEKVIITLPDGTLNVGDNVSNVITVNKNLVSYDGSKIEGATEITFKVANKTGVKGIANITNKGKDAVAAVAAKYSFDITGPATAAGTITLKNVATSDVSVTVNGNETTDQLATAIKTALEDSTTNPGVLYDVTVASGKVTLTAKTPGVIANAPTVTSAATGVTASPVKEDTKGAAAVSPEKAGFTIEITQGASNDGTVVVTPLGSAAVEIPVVKDDTPSAVATKIASAFSTNPDYSVVAAGNVLTFTAKADGAKTGTVTIVDK